MQYPLNTNLRNKIVQEIIETLALIIVTEFTSASALAAASGRMVGHSQPSFARLKQKGKNPYALNVHRPPPQIKPKASPLPMEPTASLPTSGPTPAARAIPSLARDLLRRLYDLFLDLENEKQTFSNECVNNESQ